jgi:hypothetical protein
VRHLLGIFLLFCILAPTLGTYAYLSIQKSLVRREVRRNLVNDSDRPALRRMAFTPAQRDTLLHWEHSREFEYQGRMYDVQSSESNGDSIIYWCWFDERETLINAHLDRLAQQAWDQSSWPAQAQGKLLDFYKQLYCSIPIAPTCQLEYVEATPMNPGHLAPGDWQSILGTAPPYPPPQSLLHKG